MKISRLSRILLTSLFFLLLITCKERNSDNPFDTDCPKEVFTPSDFTAEQQGIYIKLTWSQVTTNFSGFVINRNENDGTMTEVARTDKAVTSWSDNKIVGGTKYSYQLYAFAGANLSNAKEATITTPVSVATITTLSSASNITPNSAVMGGNVTSDGGATVTERGICYGTSANPTTANSKAAMGNGTGAFSSTVSGLTANTKYYAKSYAINSFGVTYGAEISFTTLQVLPATVSTTAATGILATSAVLGGNVSSDGNNTVTENGICYSLTQNPTTANTKLAIGSGTGAFSNTVTGLTAGTSYYVRAYAINGQGTAYGTQINFTTTILMSPTVTTSAALNVGSSSAVLGGNVTSDGSVAVTERGICYSITQNPTTGDTKLAIGSGTGAFSNTITGLTQITTYFARAYAINSIGTSYGAQITFTTIQVNLPNVTTAAATSVASTSAALGGNVTSDGNAAVTERGICYSLSLNPTTADTKVTIGNGSGVFSNVITGLAQNSTFYVRAYAINSQGTAYGNEVTFKTGTSISLAIISTLAPSGFTINSALAGGNITSDGNATVTERGICYATVAAPTTNSSKVAIGSGPGTYTTTITGLLANTTYYVRAYAINSQGTAYGNEVNFKIAPATLTTSAATSITMNTAILGGEVTIDGNTAVTERGICYATTQTPNVGNNKVMMGTGIGIFNNTVTGLVNNTLYYVRSYAINGVGTAYGTQVSFTTLASINVPTITTTAVNNIAQTTATSGGNITTDGGGAVTARGVCYSVAQSPTLANSYTSDGTGAGQYTSQLTNLLPGTTYYLRAYATNGAGTSYGAQVSFSTLKTVPTVTTKDVTEISAMGGISGGIISSSGGGTISAKGICWGELANPSLTDNVVSAGTGISPFNASIVTAIPGTTYYVRSYATNEVGTAYGDQKTFTALGNSNYYGFETGMLPVGWSGQWTVVSTNAFQSNYSLMSLPSVASTAILTVTLANAGQISFYYYMDLGSYGYKPSIDFYIDAVKVGSFPASSGWNQGFFEVTSGAHTFKWQFNPSYYGGTGYIDYIVFPKK
jgi:hypothetical protein